MPRRPVAIVAATGGNTQLARINKTTPTGSIMQKIKFVWPARFTTNTIQWLLGMLMQPISPISLNVITNLPKYMLNKTHRKNMNPAKQSALRSHNLTIWIIAKKLPHSGVWQLFFKECLMSKTLSNCEGIFETMTLERHTGIILIMETQMSNYHPISAVERIAKWWSNGCSPSSSHIWKSILLSHPTSLHI